MCTAMRFNDDKGNVFFGRNYDWTFSYGEAPVFTPLNYKPQSPFGAIETIKYAVLGTGIVLDGIPLYFDASNTEGLSVANLNFAQYSVYEDEPQKDKTNVCVYEFALWVASQFKSVDEVEKALDNVVVINRAVAEGYPVSPLHWMIADDKRSIVVECSKRGMEVFHNDVDVLTNQPGYEWHRDNLRNYMRLTPEYPQGSSWTKADMVPFGTGAGNDGLPGGCGAAARFVRAAYYNACYPVCDTEIKNVSRMLHSLSGVKMIDGATTVSDGSYEKTLYSSCFSSATGTYYYHTYDNINIRSTSFKDYDVNSEAVQRMGV